MKQLDHKQTHTAIIAERTLLRSMRAGCLAPLACSAVVLDGSIQILARVYSPDGKKKIEVKHTIEHALLLDRLGNQRELIRLAEQLGREAAMLLAEQGATELIHQAHA